MRSVDLENMVVISVGVDALLSCVRNTEARWRVRGDSACRDDPPDVASTAPGDEHQESASCGTGDPPS